MRLTNEELLDEFGPDAITDYGIRLRAEILQRMTEGELTGLNNSKWTAHRYERYSLRSGCKCGWGTTLCSDEEGYSQWGEHVIEQCSHKEKA